MYSKNSPSNPIFPVIFQPSHIPASPFKHLFKIFLPAFQLFTLQYYNKVKFMLNKLAGY